jgi:hypothetical protein
MEMDGAVIRNAFIAMATLLMAQAACGPLAAQPRSESGIAGVSVFGRPPPVFNPLTASNVELDEYGFPPRPDRNLGEEARKRWEQRVMSQTRIVPELAQTNVFHGPVKGIKPVKTGSGTIDATSSNWSGYAITDPTNPFVKPGSQVEAQFVVPKPASGCTDGSTETYSSANWVGIDGALSNDVFQAGTETDLDCRSGPSYYAWIEWFPKSEIKVRNLAVAPGDLISLSAFIASDGSKHLSIENLTTRKSVALAMKPPPGTELVGNSVEWIVERPTLNNVALSKLTNYLLNPWTNISAVTFPKLGEPPVAYLPDSAPASATTYHLRMSDGSNEISGVQLFSIPANAKTAPSLWFVATTPY